jgi:hypothetical protein
MPRSSQIPKYRDLQFQKAQVSNSQKEFERVHLGSRAPSSRELKTLAGEFAKNARNLNLLYAGITGVKGAPADPSAEDNNAILLLFTSKASLRNFLDQPITGPMQGISLVLDVTPAPRL